MGEVYQKSFTQETDISGNATNEPVIIILPASDRGIWTLRGFSWSYDNDPTGGRISITGGGLPSKSWGVTSGGPGFINFPSPLECNMSTDCTISMTAGGSGIRGDLNVEAELR